MEKITVLGAGSWGTALAMVLAENGHDTLIWTHRTEQAQEINEQHTNSRYLPKIEMPNNLRATAELQDAVVHASTIVIAVPTKAIPEVCEKMTPLLTEKRLFVHVSKGIEPDSLKRISELVMEGIPQDKLSDIVVLSGPSHAEEVVLHQPTTITAACKNLDAAEKVQDLFMNGYLRVYTSDDVVGVELGGALKNVIALAAGITSGLNYGDNAKAALITRGLAEITRVGVKMGGNPFTFAGLTGMGDLIATSTSMHSRNYRAGRLLGEGKKLDDVLQQMGMVVEGVRTTKAAYQLSEKYEIPMPISTALYHVLFDGQEPKAAVDALMGRDKKREVDEMMM